VSFLNLAIRFTADFIISFFSEVESCNCHADGHRRFPAHFLRDLRAEALTPCSCIFGISHDVAHSLNDPLPLARRHCICCLGAPRSVPNRPG